MVTVLYFARLREALGTGSEELELPVSRIDIATLKQTLASRGGPWAREFGQSKSIRAAVNQQMASAETLVSDGDEVAFFPPVTGG